MSILRKAGGWHPGFSLQIDNLPFFSLFIEAMDESGPIGLPALTVFQTCGTDESKRSPEMHFEISRPLWSRPKLNPFYLRNDCLRIEEWSRFTLDSHYAHLSRMHRQHEQIADAWDSTLRTQGFVEAFAHQYKRRA